MPELYSLDWTEDEKKWTKALQRLCNRVPDSLCLFGAAGLLVVLRKEDSGNGHVVDCGVIIDNIHCDGGQGDF